MKDSIDYEALATALVVQLVAKAPQLVRAVLAELDLAQREQVAAGHLARAQATEARERFEKETHDREQRRAAAEAQVLRDREAFVASVDFAVLDPRERAAFLDRGEKPLDLERRLAIFHRLREESPRQVLVVDFGLLWRFISFAERDRLEAGENLDEGDLSLRRQRARAHYQMA